MASIRLDRLRHAYTPQLAAAGTYALRQIDHTFDDGGAYALLGPSGCGKTCLLYTSPSPRDRQKSRMPSSA